MGSDIQPEEQRDEDEFVAVRAERDAAIAERDEWKRRAEYAERELSDAFGLPVAIGPAEGEAKRIVDRGRAAIAERDRLRRELEALRKHVLQLATMSGLPLLDDVASDIDDILSGGEL